jgi:hypothetical protein
VPFLQQDGQKEHSDGWFRWFFIAPQLRFHKVIPRPQNFIEFRHRADLNVKEVTMLKALIATVASIGMVGAVYAADMPHPQPPPPAGPVGKAPIGKSPIGKAPIGKTPVGKAPTPLVTKG